ncbi:GntR family transcriptional regulator [Pseudomonas sp. JM0905a]|uniref:GntR family transcriptional regulator n=1 Tax=Pseudomonas sp. JM0905a TaxID=2772484 RepID=UPI001686A2C5|nr:GntR family transcriptional regulator [Pseudomonas sp. JM0905a]MBD2837861.1 GntR family transcriptional regulator [Pseudomonas sp. JM0905a]
MRGVFSESMIDQGLPKAAQVYQLLRAAIVGLELSPGDVLSEKEISDELGVSRTPVREAVLRLVNEQMLIVRPNAGTYVSTIRLRDVLEGQLVRETIELRCVRLAARFFKPRFEDEFETLFLRKTKALERKECGEFYALDEAFHRLICDCAGYSHLWHVMHSAMGQLDRVRRLAFPIQQHFDEVIAEHREVYAAIQDRDERRAESLMSQHMDSIFESLEKVCEQRGLLIEGLTSDEIQSVRQLSSRIR